MRSENLMVRSAATPRVSNHEATVPWKNSVPYFSPTLNGGSLPDGTVSSAIASSIATMT
jgi:hypothetical protein